MCFSPPSPANPFALYRRYSAPLSFPPFFLPFCRGAFVLSSLALQFVLLEAVLRVLSALSPARVRQLHDGDDACAHDNVYASPPTTWLRALALVLVPPPPPLAPEAARFLRTFV